MQRVQGLHDIQSNAMPVTPLANDPPRPPESSPGVAISAADDSGNTSANQHSGKKLSRKQKKNGKQKKTR
jgi:hypothetical protein